MRAESFENTVCGTRLTAIEKGLAAGASQQLKICAQIAADMVSGLVLSCVPSRMSVQSVYPRLHSLYPVPTLPWRPAQIKQHSSLNVNIDAIVGAVREPSRQEICV